MTPGGSQWLWTNPVDKSVAGPEGGWYTEGATQKRSDQPTPRERGELELVAMTKSLTGRTLTEREQARNRAALMKALEKRYRPPHLRRTIQTRLTPGEWAAVQAMRAAAQA